jgi:hypothetical protein
MEPMVPLQGGWIEVITGGYVFWENGRASKAGATRATGWVDSAPLQARVRYPLSSPETSSLMTRPA